MSSETPLKEPKTELIAPAAVKVDRSWSTVWWEVPAAVSTTALGRTGLFWVQRYPKLCSMRGGGRTIRGVWLFPILS